MLAFNTNVAALPFKASITQAFSIVVDSIEGKRTGAMDAATGALRGTKQAIPFKAKIALAHQRRVLAAASCIGMAVMRILDAFIASLAQPGTLVARKHRRYVTDTRVRCRAEAMHAAFFTDGRARCTTALVAGRALAKVGEVENCSLHLSDSDDVTLTSRLVGKDAVELGLIQLAAVSIRCAYGRRGAAKAAITTPSWCALAGIDLYTLAAVVANRRAGRQATCERNGVSSGRTIVSALR